MIFVRILLAAALLALCPIAPANARTEPLDGATFRVTMQSQQFGPLDAIVHFEKTRRILVGRSSSAALVNVRAMIVSADAADWNGDALLTFRVRGDRHGNYAGRVVGPGLDSEVTLTLASGALSGQIMDGDLAGPLSGAAYVGDTPLRNYPAVLAAMDQTLPHVLFDPNLLSTPTYQIFHDGLIPVAANARDDVDLVFAVSLGWSNSVFSHFALTRQSRDAIVASVDADAQPAVEVRYDGDIAIMRVNTFLGERARTQVDEAIVELEAHAPRALIVDLRATPGGSLAAKNLIDALIPEPMVMGWFTANAWWSSHDTAPTPEQIAAAPMSTFDDPQTAIQTLMSDGLLKVESRPSAATHYAGPVFVLIDRETVSVAELAAAALGSSGRAILVGERSAGELLTADTVPLVEGFAMMTPLADYADARVGRVEGVGVAPNVTASSESALERALALARQ